VLLGFHRFSTPVLQLDRIAASLFIIVAEQALPVEAKFANYAALSRGF
jgi:hypothetical protein